MLMIGEVGKRIKIARESLQPTAMRQTDLAIKLNVSQARLSNWERGEHDPQFEFVVEAARILGVSVDWLMGGGGPPKVARPMQVYRTGFRFIPIKGAITAGMPANSNADVEWIEIKDWGGDLERWGRIIDGYSMSSEGLYVDDLQPGDIAVFEDRRAEIGNVVHAFSHGEDTVKVLRRRGGQLELWPINPDYESISGEHWSIKGVVVMRIRRRQHGIVETIEYPHGMRHRFL
jgi:SOS-response transcriptional repressor LexA